MSSTSSSILYLILALACISSSYYSLVDCDQPVFVLETSDSSESSPSQSAPIQSFVPSTPTSAAGSNKREIDNHKSNTQIITDDSAAPNAAPASNIHNTSNNHSTSGSHVVVIERHPATTHSPVVNQSSTHKKHQDESQEHSQSKQQPLIDQQSHNQVSQALKQAELQRDSPTVRRLDESPAPSQRATSTRNAPPQTRPRSTTSAPYTGEDQSSVPKSEERLLISITSEEDEYKPPQRQVIASTGGFDEVQPTTSYSQQPQQHKKKPAITISIQDNSNKQGGSGTPSVILRPSENGQSIIISTLGSSDIQSNNHDNNNKYNPNKPAIAIVSSGGHLSSNNNNNNNNNEPPYREPVVDPVQSSGSHHNTHPSTHRPTINNNNEYNPPANRPIVSTLLDQPRPPVNVLGTQRPQVVSLNEDYEPSRPSTSSPIHSRPTSQPGYNNNENAGPQAGFGGGDIPTTGGNGGGSKYPLNEKSCGVIHETRIVGGDEADPNDFLWMAAIIKSKPTDGEVKPFCGGSLITRRHILTAAHCLDGLAPRDVLVRLGSYDFDDSTASPLSNDYAIDQFRKPSQYNKKTHVADIAIMRLKTPLQTSDNYRTVCMPQARRSYVGALGTVTGYGSQSQTFRRAAPKLRQVTVPIWENRKCSAVYKKNLTESFLCAGYEEGGKDACQGDSGGPLMTEGPQERTIVVGVVSHGIGCGSPGYPGVYTRTSTFLDWIEENTRE